MNPYRIPISSILRKAGTAGHFELEVLAPSGIGDSFYGVKGGSPVKVEVELSSMKSGLIAEGEIFAIEEGRCSMCLKGIKKNVCRRFEAFMPAEKERMERFLDEAHCIYPLRGDFADLEGLIRDELALQLSAVRLCSPDCKGLCQKCGADLNQEENHFHAKETDPRLARLEGLKRRLQC